MKWMKRTACMHDGDDDDDDDDDDGDDGNDDDDCSTFANLVICN